MLNTPFSPWPSFTAEEASAIENVLLSNKVNYGTGEECRLFESEFAAWRDTKYAIALAIGALALELALRALDIALRKVLLSEGISASGEITMSKFKGSYP
jgi:dTDP-4-amino-4,6-dideoxygalactose transaminase